MTQTRKTFVILGTELRQYEKIGLETDTGQRVAGELFRVTDTEIEVMGPGTQTRKVRKAWLKYVISFRTGERTDA
jgi:hypothetical protein